MKTTKNFSGPPSSPSPSKTSIGSKMAKKLALIAVVFLMGHQAGHFSDKIMAQVVIQEDGSPESLAYQRKLANRDAEIQSLKKQLKEWEQPNSIKANLSSSTLTITANDSDGSTTTTTPAKFAYAFVISGCYDFSCHGYMLNILVASQVLKSVNSSPDIVLMVRMSSRTNATRLDPLYEEWLGKANIRLRYIPKLHGNQDNFGIATIEKFRILDLIEYDRVLFLDADIIPVCNMDYMFEESYKESGMLSEYNVIQGGVAPATGSVFLIKPKAGGFAEIIQIIQKHRERPLNPTRFDPQLGWGHRIHVNDTWQSWNRGPSSEWNFYGVTVDQGLLWHWVKYQQMNFSHILQGGLVDTWREVTGNEKYWRSQTPDVFPVEDGKRFIARVNRTKHVPKGCGGHRLGRGGYATRAPTSDYIHYSGWQKPWNRPINSSMVPENVTVAFTKNNGQLFWLYYLGEVNRTLNLSLPDLITVPKGNPLGNKPGSNDLLSPDVELPTLQ